MADDVRSPSQTREPLSASHVRARQAKKKKSSIFSVPKFGKSKKKADEPDDPPPPEEAAPEAEEPKMPPPPGMEGSTAIPILTESLSASSLDAAPSLRDVPGVSMRTKGSEPAYAGCQPAGLTIGNSPLKTEELPADKKCPPTFANSWDDGVGAHFNVRVGPNYKRTGAKAPSALALYEARDGAKGRAAGVVCAFCSLSLSAL